MKKNYSLGHLSYVFVSQAHPQVIVFMQQNLLLTRVSDATRLIPEEHKTHTDWQWHEADGKILGKNSALIKTET